MNNTNNTRDGGGGGGGVFVSLARGLLVLRYGGGLLKGQYYRHSNHKHLTECAPSNCSSLSPFSVEIEEK